MNRKLKLIQLRNKILDNLFKYHLPCYKKTLKRIDILLDKIEMEEYLKERKLHLEVKNPLEIQDPSLSYLYGLLYLQRPQNQEYYEYLNRSNKNVLRR